MTKMETSGEIADYLGDDSGEERNYYLGYLAFDFGPVVEVSSGDFVPVVVEEES